MIKNFMLGFVVGFVFSHLVILLHYLTLAFKRDFIDK